MDITKAFSLLLKQEGTSLTDVRNDRGGLTKYGIDSASHPDLDIASLTQEQAEQIYLKEYWIPSKSSELPAQLQYAVFSCAVNCGVISAVKILQRACHVTDDGEIGPITIEASKKISLQDFCIEWGCHYAAIIEKNPNQAIFRQGWNNRIDTILKWYKNNLLN